MPRITARRAGAVVAALAAAYLVAVAVLSLEDPAPDKGIFPIFPMPRGDDGEGAQQGAVHLHGENGDGGAVDGNVEAVDGDAGDQPVRLAGLLQKRPGRLPPPVDFGIEQVKREVIDDNFFPPAGDDNEMLRRSLFGIARYLTHVTTDKPTYRAGDTLYARAFVLGAFDRVPFMHSNVYLGSTAEVLAPSGQIEYSGPVTANGTIPFQWVVPTTAVGGEYTLRITHKRDGFPPAVRKFTVQRTTRPRMRLLLEFAERGYGPGETVTATLTVSRAEGGIPVGAEVTFSARVEGRSIAIPGASLSLGENGSATASFALPDRIDVDEGSVTAVVRDGGVVESTTRTLPLVVKALVVKAYPEGGDLVLGLLNGVYFEARDTRGEPVSIAGYVVAHAPGTQPVLGDDASRIVSVTAEHEGRAYARFIPVAGKWYSLVVVRPAGVKATFPLPEVKDAGVAMITAEPAYASGEAISLRVSGTQPGEYKVVAYRREREIGFADVSIREPGKPVDVALSLPVGAAFEGVLRITVYAKPSRPVAERLVYRVPHSRVRVVVEADSPEYVPGGGVDVTVTTLDAATGKPVRALVGVTVTDDSVLSRIEPRRRAPRLPEMALLEDEVESFFDPAGYVCDEPLTGIDEKCARNIDLLLGTQGWRRWVYTDEERLEGQRGAADQRLLAIFKGERAPPKIFRAMPMAMAMREQVADAALAAAAPVPAPPAEFGGAGVAMDDGVQADADVQEVDAQNIEADVDVVVDAEDADIDEVDITENANAGAAEAPAGVAQEAIMEPRINAKMMADAPAARMMFRPPVVYVPQPMYVREYAHTLRPGWRADERTDFVETVYWCDHIQTGADGRATVRFSLSDLVTEYRVVVDAVAKDGGLGSHDGVLLPARKAFAVEARIPPELTLGDSLVMPIAVLNRASRPVEVTLRARMDGGTDTIGQPLTTYVEAHANGVAHQTLSLPVPGTDATTDEEASSLGERRIVFQGETLPKTSQDLRLRDSQTLSTNVVPLGFPVKGHASALTKTGVSYSLAVPDDALPGATWLTAHVYPSPIGNILSALEALIQEPYGCFEQTSATTYPMVMALRFLTLNPGAPGAAAAIERARTLLEKGYDRLVGFETKDGGFEWFGQSPGHEALTAYGLLQFLEMREVIRVDATMTKRTQEWLLSRRNAKGGFNLNSARLDTFGGATALITNLYITWSLSEAGIPLRSEEVAYAREAARTSTDGYVLALVASILYNVKDDKAAAKVAATLGELQQKDGGIIQAETSITSSGGEALVVETTALAAIAWSHDIQQFGDNAFRALSFLGKNCQGGRFASTQATVLALKAILAYREAVAKRGPGDTGAVVTVSVDEQDVARAEYAAGATDAVVFDSRKPEFAGLAKAIAKPGTHNVQVRIEQAGKGRSVMVAVSSEMTTPRPPTSLGARIALNTSLSADNFVQGDSVDVVATVANLQATRSPMTTAIIGLPSGLEPRHDSLRELVDSNVISYFEVTGRAVVLYWRTLAPNAVVRVKFDATAVHPGTFTGAASRAYLYYTDELKHWANPLSITISPRT